MCSRTIAERPIYQLVLDGTNRSVDGLHLGAGSDASVIQGINIRNTDVAIRLTDAGDMTIRCNFLGTTEDGTGEDTDDADTGANRLQNTPVISQSLLSEGMVKVGYTVDSDPANQPFPITVDIYLAAVGGDEGRSLLATIIRAR